MHYTTLHCNTIQHYTKQYNTTFYWYRDCKCRPRAKNEVAQEKCMLHVIYREYNFRALARKLSFLPTELDIFYIRHLFSIYLSTSDLLNFVISKTEKHEFSI